MMSACSARMDGAARAALMTCILLFASPGAPGATRRGLLVGINNYAPGYASSLQYCVNDAEGIRDTMMLGDTAGRWPAANIRLLTNAQATKTAIRAALQTLAAQSRAGDVVVYYHSSHGYQYSGTSACICTYNADYADTELGIDLARFNSGVSVIVILDTCHSAGMFKSRTWKFAENAMASFRAEKARQLAAAGLPTPKSLGSNIGFMTACDYNEPSWESPPHGLFTGAILQACGDASADSNRDGELQFMELHNYAAAETVEDQTAQYLNAALLNSIPALAAPACMASPVYRFWSPVFSAHFFTINEVEKNNVIRNLSQYWTYECVAYEAYTARVPGTVPLYRFWSPVFSGHFFTINETEKNNVIRNLSQYWTYEGVAYYVYPSPAAGTAPVYRFWSPVFSHHFYTISEVEKNNVIRNLSRYWDYETVAFYTIPTARSRSMGAAAAGAVVQEPEDEGAVGFTGSMAGLYVGATESADDGASARPLVTMSSPVPANAPLALDVAIPLECPGLTVWAYAREEGTDEWTCIMDGVESPDEALLTGLAADSAYQVEIWAADQDSGAPFRLQAGLVEQTTEVPADVFDLDATASGFALGVGNPLVGLTVPDTRDPLTLQLASPWEGTLLSAGPGEAGAVVVFELPACNRWYWIGGASEAAARVLPRWLRYEIVE